MLANRQGILGCLAQQDWSLLGPLKSYLPALGKEGKSSNNPHFFRGELLIFQGVYDI